MARGKLNSEWMQTTSLLRIICLSFSGQEPPLESLVPEEFRPKVKELTEKEKELLKAKKALDIKIMNQLRAEGKPIRVKRHGEAG